MRSMQFIAALVVLVACANDPLPTTPTTDSPCGVSYVACYTGDVVTGCCGEYNTCCSGAICPKGYCENMGGDGIVGGARFTPQWKPWDPPPIGGHR